MVTRSSFNHHNHFILILQRRNQGRGGSSDFSSGDTMLHTSQQQIKDKEAIKSGILLSTSKRCIINANYLNYLSLMQLVTKSMDISPCQSGFLLGAVQLQFHFI